MKIAMAGAAALLCVTAHAQTWMPIGQSDDIHMSVDVQSVRRQGAYIKMWNRYTYGTPQYFPGSPPFTFKSLLMLNYFDCKSRAFASKQGSYYADADGTGKVLYTFTHAEAHLDFQDPVPGTLGSDLVDTACGIH